MEKANGKVEVNETQRLAECYCKAFKNPLKEKLKKSCIFLSDAILQ